MKMNKFSILSNAGWTRHGFVNRNIILGPPQKCHMWAQEEHTEPRKTSYTTSLLIP